MKNKYLECGKITNTHGVHGLVRIDPWCDSPEVFASLRRICFQDKSGNFTERALKSAFVSKGMVIASIEGVDTYEDAVARKNTILWCLREDIPLPQGAMFVADMIGLRVYDADTGRVYGTLAEVIESAASDLYRIHTDGGDVLLPAVEEFVKGKDPEQGIAIRPIPGFFDDHEI